LVLKIEYLPDVIQTDEHQYGYNNAQPAVYFVFGKQFGLPEKRGKLKQPFQGHKHKSDRYEYPGNVEPGPAHHSDRNNSRDQLNDHGQEQGDLENHFFVKLWIKMKKGRPGKSDLNTIRFEVLIKQLIAGSLNIFRQSI
jgi:hypothetical protein